ncbi:conserved Plasmodium protein, unknown function [Plasmodium malariae]|uniref:Uncharacterized protein n=1 Tax=Plasmodium malariae TaxID=5858 RepID=A0A1C3KLP7_PLAMA|nr:conserved Plasmodium protein, unknown function [Plasmodium malariae]
MEEKILQTHITLLFYLMLIFYLNNFTMNFIDMPRKLFKCVKVYYSFLIILTIVGFFNRLFSLIRVFIVQTVNRIINSYIIKHRVKNVHINRSTIRLKRNNGNLTVIKNNVISSCLTCNVNKEGAPCSSSTDEINCSNAERTEKEEISKDRGGDSISCSISSDNNNGGSSCSSSSDSCNSCELAGVTKKRKKHRKRSYSIYKYISSDLFWRKNKYNLLGKDERKLTEQHNEGVDDEHVKNAGLCNTPEQNKDAETAAVNGVMSAREDSARDRVQNTDDKVNSVRINKNLNFHNHLSKQKYSSFFSILCDIIYNSKNYVKVNNNMKWLSGEPNRELSNRKGIYDKSNNDMNSSCVNEANSLTLNKPEKRVLKSILKKSVSTEEGNISKSKKCSNKHIRFNSHVETYFFEKYSSEQDMYNKIYGKIHFTKLLDEYNLINTDIFSYYNMRSNLNVVFNDIVNSVYDYKDKIVKKF